VLNDVCISKGNTCKLIEKSTFTRVLGKAPKLSFGGGIHLHGGRIVGNQGRAGDP
jgi:hypothetical protein